MFTIIATLFNVLQLLHPHRYYMMVFMVGYNSNKPSTAQVCILRLSKHWLALE